MLLVLDLLPILPQNNFSSIPGYTICADFKVGESYPLIWVAACHPKSGSLLSINLSPRPLCGLLRANGLLTRLVSSTKNRSWLSDGLARVYRAYNQPLGNRILVAWWMASCLISQNLVVSSRALR